MSIIGACPVGPSLDSYGSLCSDRPSDLSSSHLFAPIFLPLFYSAPFVLRTVPDRCTLSLAATPPDT